MPEQEPRKITWSLLPAAVLVVLVCGLSMPIVVELIRSFGHVFTKRIDASLAEIFLGIDRIFLLTRSLAIAGLIALASVSLGVPVARVVGARLRGRGLVFASILIAPIWLPSALVYAAGNLLRAPDTIIGRAIVSFSTSSDDLRWVTIWAGYFVAVGGLAIWSAPISGLLIAAGLGHRSSMYDEMIAIEPIGVLRRARLWIGINRAALFRAWTLTTVLMLGSAVPMHLAQLDTWSIVIWRQLAQSSIDQWGGVWVSSLPMILIAVFGAWVLTRSLIDGQDRAEPIDRGYGQIRLPRHIIGSAIFVWALGALAPLIAMLVTLDDLGSILHFWTLESQAMRDSGFIAIIVGLFTMLVALLVTFSLSHPNALVRRLGAVAVFALCILGLIPGVLVGAAVAQVSFFGLTSGVSGAVLASCIRSAFLGAIIGSLCARSESIERRSVRWQLVGGSIVGWKRAVMPTIWMPIIASVLVGGLYSMYEIEAAVMVRPPGMDNLPQQLLSDLHYARIEQLSAAGINLLAIGLLVSVLGSMLLVRIRISD